MTTINDSGIDSENTINVLPNSSQPNSVNNHIIRQLEVEAYSALISALFAQGELTWRKDQLLQEIRWALKIPDEVHKRELVRVHTDSSLQKLHTLTSTIPNELYSSNSQSNHHHHYNNNNNSSNNNGNMDKNKPPARKKRKVTYSPSRITYDDSLESEKTSKRNTNQRKIKVKEETSKSKKKDDIPTFRDESEEELKAKKARIEQEKEEILRRLASLNQVEESDEEMNDTTTSSQLDATSDLNTNLFSNQNLQLHHPHHPHPNTTTTTEHINHNLSSNTAINYNNNNFNTQTPPNMILNFTNTDSTPTSTSSSIIQPPVSTTFTLSSNETIQDI